MKILVAVDFSPITDKVFNFILDLSKKIEFTVWIVHFVGYEVGPQTERDFIAKKYHEKHKNLQNKAKEFKDLGLKVTALLLQGPTVETILEEADRMDADLIVAGSHGHGMMYDLFVGSVSRELLKKSRRPVVIIPVEED